MQKIGWIERKTNEVLIGVQENGMLLKAILSRKENWLGAYPEWKRCNDSHFGGVSQGKKKER